MDETGVSEAELWVGEMRGLTVRGCPVLLVRHEDGIAAYRDRCPHQGYPLSAGELAGGAITCRLHRHRFDAATGDGINPARPCLVKLGARVTNGYVFVEPEPAPKLSDR